MAAGSAGGICVGYAAVFAPRDAGGGTDLLAAASAASAWQEEAQALLEAAALPPAWRVAWLQRLRPPAKREQQAGGHALLSFSYFLIISSHSAIDSNIIGLPSAVMAGHCLLFRLLLRNKVDQDGEARPQRRSSMSFLSSNSVFGASAAKAVSAAA